MNLDTQPSPTHPHAQQPGSQEQSLGRLTVAEEAFELWRKRVGALLAPAAFVAVCCTCGDLTPQGRTLAGILAAVGVLWVSEALPLPVTALAGAVLCVLLGVADARQVLGSFADPVVFVFLGGFILARAMTVHGLDRRIAISLLAAPVVGGSPTRILAAIGLATAGISMWVSNSATTAMMLPIALGVLGAMHEARVASGVTAGPIDTRGWPYATAMMLMVAYGASIGGLGTPVGSPPNLIGIGLIEKATGVEISFFRWMALCLPMALLMGLALFGLLWWMARDRGTRVALLGDSASPSSARDARSTLRTYVQQQQTALGPMSRGELNTLIAFGVAITLWTLPGLCEALVGPDQPWVAELKTRLPESIVALLAAVLLFVLPVDLPAGRFTLTWREAERIEWGVIVLFGGGMALGTLMFQTGVAEAMGRGMAESLGVHSLWGFTALSIAMAIVLSETASNTASANMIIPVVIAIAQSAEISPLPPALGACLGASFGFMLPVSTPPNAIVYGSGLVPLERMLRAGAALDVVGLAIIWLGLRLLCPLLGLV